MAADNHTTIIGNLVEDPELRFADGHTPSNYPGRWPRTFETEQPDRPTEPSLSGRWAKDNHAALSLAGEGVMTW